MRLNIKSILLLAALTPGGARAGYVTWTNASGDSQWSNPANWSTGALPASSDYPGFPTEGNWAGGLVDLGGAVRSVNGLEVGIGPNCNFIFTDGTLCFSGSSSGISVDDGSAQLDAGLTTQGSVIRLSPNPYKGSTLTVSGMIGGNNGAGRNDFSLVGAGLLTNANTYTGSTTVADPGLTLGGTLGAIANSSSIAINANGVLDLNNTQANNNNRLLDSAPITFDSGTLALDGNATQASSESVGAVSLVMGGNTLSVHSMGGGATLSIQSLSRRVGTGLYVSWLSPFGKPPAQILIGNAAGLPLVGGGGANGASPLCREQRRGLHDI